MPSKGSYVHESGSTPVAARLRELKARRSNKTILGIEKESSLARFAAYHLEEKARAGETTKNWMAQIELHLTRAIEFLGADRDIASIGVADVQAYSSWLAEIPAKGRSEEHTSELQSRGHLVCRLLLEKKKKKKERYMTHV